MSKTQISINGVNHDFAASPLATYLSARGITPETGGIAVAVNDRVIPRGEWSAFSPSPGDRIEIITAIGGG